MQGDQLALKDDQIDQLKTIAKRIVEGLAWDQLAWNDAWAGKHPEPPTEEQVGTELSILVKKVERIMVTGRIDDEFSTIEECRRMAYLEGCPAFWLLITSEGRTQRGPRGANYYRPVRPARNPANQVRSVRWRARCEGAHLPIHIRRQQLRIGLGAYANKFTGEHEIDGTTRSVTGFR